MEARGGTLAYQRARERRSKRHRERIRHERPLGMLEFNPYGMRRGSLGTTVLAPQVPDSVYRNRTMALGVLILLGSLGLGLLTAKIKQDDEGEG
jgi:hypothetical protein